MEKVKIVLEGDSYWKDIVRFLWSISYPHRGLLPQETDGSEAILIPADWLKDLEKIAKLNRCNVRLATVSDEDI